METANGWFILEIPKRHINLDVILKAGQTFRFQKCGHVWRGVARGLIWLFCQNESQLFYQVLGNFTDTVTPAPGDKPPKTKKRKLSSPVDSGTDFTQAALATNTNSEPGHESIRATLADFLQLSVNIDDLYEKWNSSDNAFKKISSRFPGIRLLRQDPVECLFSFICSSNNHISRISGMVERLCHSFGPVISAPALTSQTTPKNSDNTVAPPHLDDVLDTTNMTSYYNFPSIERLAMDDVESVLRKEGFGYRAAYVPSAARKILDLGGQVWLMCLRDVPYASAHKQLVQLSGVGAKVADCVCLMSLDHPEAVPIDTHVWQMTCRIYMPKLLKSKSLNAKLYKEIGDFYRDKFGSYAGWAHDVIFCADLKQFESYTISVDEMESDSPSEKGFKPVTKSTQRRISKCSSSNSK